MKAMDFTSRWVLVTGASSGLGEAMARQLASRHHANLILVARRAERLDQLKTELEATGVQCHCIAADLSRPEDVERVYAEAVATGEVHAVILNAGVTHFGRHLELDWPAFQSLLATNVTSLVRLTSLFCPYLMERGQGGGLLLVSSIAGFLPVPYQAAYAGSKAFVTNFAQSLAAELRDSGISLTVFAPGGIATAMTHDSGLRYFENTPFLQGVESCAADGLRALQTRQPLQVPGVLNRAQLLAARLVPRGLVARITENAYRRALGKA